MGLPVRAGIFAFIWQSRHCEYITDTAPQQGLPERLSRYPHPCTSRGPAMLPHPRKGEGLNWVSGVSQTCVHATAEQVWVRPQGVLRSLRSELHGTQFHLTVRHDLLPFLLQAALDILCENSGVKPAQHGCTSAGPISQRQDESAGAGKIL